jgi:PEP-CTERM motif
MTRTLGILTILLGMAISALPLRADTLITLTGAGAGNVLDGVYTSPYTGTVGGVANTPIICDDFADDSYIGESWSATVSTVASLAGNVKWASEANAQQNYEIAAWLAEDLLSTSNKTATEDISFAIWLALDPNVATYLSSDPGTLSAAEGWITTAENAITTEDLTAADFSNVLVYTPVAGTAVNCNSGPCPADSPQEFLVVTPEPGSFFLLLLGLLAVAGFTWRRRSGTSFAAN